MPQRSFYLSVRESLQRDGHDDITPPTKVTLEFGEYRVFYLSELNPLRLPVVYKGMRLEIELECCENSHLAR